MNDSVQTSNTIRDRRIHLDTPSGPLQLETKLLKAAKRTPPGMKWVPQPTDEHTKRGRDSRVRTTANLAKLCFKDKDEVDFRQTQPKGRSRARAHWKEYSRCSLGRRCKMHIHVRYAGRNEELKRGMCAGESNGCCRHRRSTARTWTILIAG